MATKKQNTDMEFPVTRQILFTSSYELCYDVRFTINLKSPDMIISKGLPWGKQSEVLKVKFKELFDRYPPSHVCPTNCTSLVSHPQKFAKVVRQILRFVRTTKISPEFPLVVRVDVINGKGKSYDFPYEDFWCQVTDLFNFAWLIYFARNGPVQDIVDEPAGKVKEGKEIVAKPLTISTLIKRDVNGRHEVFTFSNRKTALRQTQAVVDRIAKGYSRKQLPRE
jgi:hypothetical protein